MLNSGGANCFTGSFGFQTTHQTAEKAAELLGVERRRRPDLLDGPHRHRRRGVPRQGARRHRAGHRRAQRRRRGSGIPRHHDDRLASRSASVVTRDGWTIGGMAKGAGMLAPGLATMLVVITTDAVLDAAQADAALRARDARHVRPARLRRLHVDERPGDAHGERRVAASPRTPTSSPPRSPRCASTSPSSCRATPRARATTSRSRSCTRHPRPTRSRWAARVARNNLFKAAIFGNDPNWGRVLAAIGTTDAEFDPYDVDVWMNGVRVCTSGGPDAPREDVDLTPRATDLVIDLKVGDGDRDDPHERPHARLRPREQRLRLMTDIDSKTPIPARPAPRPRPSSSRCRGCGASAIRSS